MVGWLGGWVAATGTRFVATAVLRSTTAELPRSRNVAKVIGLVEITELASEAAFTAALQDRQHLARLQVRLQQLNPCVSGRVVGWFAWLAGWWLAIGWLVAGGWVVGWLGGWVAGWVGGPSQAAYSKSQQGWHLEIR